MNPEYPNNLIDVAPTIDAWKDELQAVLSGARDSIIENIGRVDTYVDSIVGLSEYQLLSLAYLQQALYEILISQDISHELDSDRLDKLCFLLLKYDIPNVDKLLKLLDSNVINLENKPAKSRKAAHMLIEVVGRHFTRHRHDSESDIESFYGILSISSRSGGRVSAISIFYLIKLFGPEKYNTDNLVEMLLVSQTTYKSFIAWILNTETVLGPFEEIVYKLIRQDSDMFKMIVEKECQAVYSDYLPPCIYYGDKTFLITTSLAKLSIARTAGSDLEKLIDDNITYLQRA